MDMITALLMTTAILEFIVFAMGWSLMRDMERLKEIEEKRNKALSELEDALDELDAYIDSRNIE